MLSAGTHLLVRLVTFFAVLITVLFVGLYYQFGTTGILTALATSGLWLIGFFGTVWDKVKEPLTKRLEYLNQHAFTPLVEWCNFSADWKMSPSLDSASKAFSALQIHRRYLTIGLYPKKLLQITDWLVQNTPEYDRLWSDIQEASNSWIQNHLNEWATVATNVSMAAVVVVLGFEQPQPQYPIRSEMIELHRLSLEEYREKNKEQVTRFVDLQKNLQEKRSAMSTILNQYMGTNMLHKPSTGQPP